MVPGRLARRCVGLPPVLRGYRPCPSVSAIHLDPSPL